MAEPVQITLFLEEPPGAAGEGAGKPLSLETGQTVSGTVQVAALEDVEYSTLRVEFLWHTEGKGNRASGTGATVCLAKDGQWRGGERQHFPFSFKAPFGPVSYQGKILKVLWNLEARLERSMLRSQIKESLPILLRHAQGGEEADLGPTPQKREQLEAAKRGLGGIWVAFAVVLLLGGVVFGASHGWELDRWQRVLMVLFLAGGFLLMLKGMWGRLGRGKLGEPTVQLSTTSLRLGEAIRFSLAMRPEQRTELRSLDVILECEERVVHGHGQYQSHRRKVVFERRISLAEDLLVEPHRGIRRKGTITLPEDGPPSFGAPDNQVVWWLRFQGDIVGWPDWKEPFLLTVRP